MARPPTAHLGLVAVRAAQHHERGCNVAQGRRRQPDQSVGVQMLARLGLGLGFGLGVSRYCLARLPPPRET